MGLRRIFKLVCRISGYFEPNAFDTALATFEKYNSFKLVPKSEAPVTMAMAINEASKAYSMEVTP